MIKRDFLCRYAKDGHVNKKDIDDKVKISYSNILKDKNIYIKDNIISRLILIDSANGLINIEDGSNSFNKIL